jgi:hypothetical protein
VSDVYDWYKLGQHISNMKGLGKHDFGAGPPSSIISFGDEETEHEFIKDLEATGLDVTDIDPKDPRQPTGMRKVKTDPTYNVDEGLGKTLATGALAAAAALGQPAQAQDVGRTAYQIGKQIYQPSGIFTRAGAEEELKGIARDMARGSREIRVGGKLIYGGPRPQGERVASNAAAASAEEAYRQALENAINRAQQQHGPITLGPGGWKVADYEADQMGNTFRAMVAIEGPAPRRESIQTPVSRSQKDREDYYKFVMGKAATGRPLTRSEQEFIKTYRLQQKLQSKVAEDAAGYIPTKKQAQDPRFKTALTVDIRPGQVGKEANKLGLQTDSQGRPALLIKNLANALKEYKETGVFEAVNPVTPAVPDPRQKIDPYQGQAQKRQTPQNRPKKKKP